jgi:hypothetical protein
MARLLSLLHALGKNLFPCQFQLLEASSSIPWFMSSFLQLKAWFLSNL